MALRSCIFYEDMKTQAGTNFLKATKLRDVTFAVIDVETTGLNPIVDRVVEVACVLLRSGRVVDTFSSFVNPGREIPATASAVHHITAGHVQGAPRLEILQPQLSAMCQDAVVVAHNAAFDLAFLPFLAQRPVLCSMRLAMRVVPEAPNYKNQVLRYHLGVDAEFGKEPLAHRALGDAQITSRVLAVCLERYLAEGGSDDIVALLEEVAAPRRLTALNFGRYRGVAIAHVPTDYLRWIEHECQSSSIDARYIAECEIRRRESISNTSS